MRSEASSHVFGFSGILSAALTAPLLAENGGGQQYLAELGLNPAQHYLGLDVTEAAQRVSNVHKGGKVYKAYEGR